MNSTFSYNTYPWNNPDKFVKNKNVTICYRTYGDLKNPALVMIMGTSASGTFWSPELCQQIADKGYFVITPDNRDTGQSTSYENWKGNRSPRIAFFRSLIRKEVEAPYTLYDMAEDYYVLLNELGIKKANFLGTSLGGMIVQIIASEYSQIVSSAIIASSCKGSYKDIIPGFKYLFFCEYKRRAFRNIQDGELRAFKYLKWLFHFIDNRKNIRDIEEVDKLVSFNVARNLAQGGGVRQMLAIIKSLPFDNILQNIKVPTLIMCGKRDIVFNFKKSKKLADGISGSKLILMEDMGHAIMPSLHNEFSEIVVNYLQRK